MPAADNYGLFKGTPDYVTFPVDSSTADIKAGDMLVFDTAGYVARAAAGANEIVGFAGDDVASPSADGGATVEVDVSTDTWYKFPPDAGTVTVALRSRTCDVGGVRSVDIDASTDDVLLIRDVDVENNLCFVSRVVAYTGVV